MSDVDTIEAEGAFTNEAPVTIYHVPVVKAKTTIEVDLAKLPDPIYQEVVAQGLKVLVNGGMTKVTLEHATGDTDEAKEASLRDEAMTIAKARVEAMITGTLKLGRKAATTSSKGSGAEMTEARRLARIAVKDAMKAKHIRVTSFTASQITELANNAMAENPVFLEQARANLAARSSKGITVTLPTAFTDSAEKVKERKVVKKGGPISVAEAGKVAPRSGKVAPRAQALN
jgi:hypothetical protein